MTVQTSTATDLHHEVRGGGPAVLFIPGASGDGGSFERVADRLADEFTIVTYDRRGNSRSPRLSEGERMTVAGQADDAAELLSALGVAPAIVFGTSGGGAILLELIGRRPEVVRAAVVHEPALIADVPARSADGFDEVLALAERDPTAAMEAFLRHVTTDETFESIPADRRERVLGNGANFFRNEFEAYGTYSPDTERIRATGVPVRLLLGRDGMEDDRAATRWLAGRLATPIEHVSGHHVPYVQHPEVFAEELRPILHSLC